MVQRRTARRESNAHNFRSINHRGTEDTEEEPKDREKTEEEEENPIPNFLSVFGISSGFPLFSLGFGLFTLFLVFLCVWFFLCVLCVSVVSAFCLSVSLACGHWTYVAPFACFAPSHSRIRFNSRKFPDTAKT
jgi:hypothetical protein